MHLLAVILIALAGALYCAAAARRWVVLARPEERRGDWLTLLWAALALHSVSLVVSLFEDGHRDFAYALLALWAGVAGVLFVSRFLAAPSRGLLVLPVGGMALLVAVAGATRVGAPRPDVAGMPWITLVHIVFMGAHLAAMIVAGAAAGMYLLAVRQLKNPTARALVLPPLPLTERLTERSLVVGAALLTGGLATGGAAIRLSSTFTLAHPTALIGLATLVLLVIVLGLRAANRVNRRGLAIAAMGCCLLAALGSFSQLIIAHGRT